MAVIVVVPAANPAAVPLAMTLAIVVVDEVQVTG